MKHQHESRKEPIMDGKVQNENNSTETETDMFRIDIIKNETPLTITNSISLSN